MAAWVREVMLYIDYLMAMVEPVDAANILSEFNRLMSQAVIKP